ncbi:hypothetical protein JXB31_00040 [Candidatus Woesearchaeota archaeon]|nr:hypothetical protein [Candidatus Woesearchaeota archaeon]
MKLAIGSIIAVFMLVLLVHTVIATDYIVIDDQKDGVKDWKDCNIEFKGEEGFCKDNMYYFLTERDGKCAYKKYFDCECRENEITGKGYADVCKHKYIPEADETRTGYYARQGVLTEFYAWDKWCRDGTLPEFDMLLTNFEFTDKTNCEFPEDYIALNELSHFILMTLDTELSSEAEPELALNYYKTYKKEVPFYIIRRYAETKSTPEEQKAVYEEYGVLDKVPVYVSRQWEEPAEENKESSSVFDWIKNVFS